MWAAGSCCGQEGEECGSPGGCSPIGEYFWVQTDGQFEAVVTPKLSYGSVATQATLVPTRQSNGTSGGAVPPSGGAGPQPVGARALVVYGVPTRMSVDEIFWHADRLRIGVGERAVQACWLVGLDRRRGKTASSLVLYFSGVVPVRGGY